MAALDFGEIRLREPGPSGDLGLIQIGLLAEKAEVQAELGAGVDLLTLRPVHKCQSGISLQEREACRTGIPPRPVASCEPATVGGPMARYSLAACRFEIAWLRDDLDVVLEEDERPPAPVSPETFRTGMLDVRFPVCQVGMRRRQGSGE